MKTKNRFLVSALGVAALLSAGGLRASDDVRVGVVVEVTAEGRKIQPNQGNPVYYRPIVLGYREMGGALTYYQRPAPAPSAVENALIQALAGQGYQVAQGSTPAAEVIVSRWGIVDPEMKPVFNEKDQAVDKIEPVNDSEMIALIVGERWYGIYPSENPDAQELVADLHDQQASRYFLIVSAYDAPAYANHQQKLLWRAHVSSQYWGHYLDQVLQPMITVSAPYFGKRTNRPEMITAEAAALGTPASVSSVP